MMRLKKHQYTDTEILQGIKDINADVLAYIYDQFFTTTKHYILQNEGTYEESQDVFKVSMRLIFNKVQQEDVVLNCSFQALILSIVKVKWNESQISR